MKQGRVAVLNVDPLYSRHFSLSGMCSLLPSLKLFVHEAVSLCWFARLAQACLTDQLPSLPRETVHWLTVLYVEGVFLPLFAPRNLISSISMMRKRVHVPFLCSTCLICGFLLSFGLLQTLVRAWWARASACLLADPTMSGRRNWSETGSTHRLCAMYSCWTTLSRHSKSM